MAERQKPTDMLKKEIRSIVGNNRVDRKEEENVEYDHAHSATPRTSEIGVMLPGPASRIDDVFRDWSTTAGLVVVESPHDDVFGRTFVVADPDGNLVRVAPVD